MGDSSGLREQLELLDLGWLGTGGRCGGARTLAIGRAEALIGRRSESFNRTDRSGRDGEAVAGAGEAAVAGATLLDGARQAEPHEPSGGAVRGVGRDAERRCELTDAQVGDDSVRLDGRVRGEDLERTPRDWSGLAAEIGGARAERDRPSIVGAGRHYAAGGFWAQHCSTYQSSAERVMRF